MSLNIDMALHSEIKKLFGKFAIPGMIGMLIVSLYNLVDGIFVGQFIGPEAVGAISIAIPIVIVNQAIAILIGSGSMALFSRSIGAKDQTTSNKIFGTLVLSVAILSGLFSVFVFFFSTDIMLFLGAKKNVLVLGNEYLRTLSFGLVFGSVGPAVNMLLRGEGKMKQAMWIMAVGTVLNIMLDPIMIYYLNMGISGAAAATVISQSVLFIISISYALTPNSVIPVSLKHFRFYTELLPKILPIGMGPMIMLLMVVIQQTFLFKILSGIGGSDQLALMGASYRVYYFSFVPMWGIAQGLLPLIGINYGAQNFKRVKAIFNSFTLKATLIASGMWLLLMLFGKTLLGWFITDSNLVATGTELFKVLNCAVFAAGLLNTPIAMFQGIGKAKQPLIILIGRQVFFFIPLLYILPSFLGIIGVWLAIPISDLLIAMIALVLIAREKKQMPGKTIPAIESPVVSQKPTETGEKTLSIAEGEVHGTVTKHDERKSPDISSIEKLQNDPENELIKVKLVKQIRRLIEDQGVTPTEAVELLGITPAQVSALFNCRPVPVSVGRLIEFLTTLGQDVEVIIKPASAFKERQQGRMSVKLQSA
jgi:putative MATE family efflux protein